MEKEEYITELERLQKMTEEGGDLAMAFQFLQERYYFDKVRFHPNPSSKTEAEA